MFDHVAASYLSASRLYLYAWPALPRHVTGGLSEGAQTSVYRCTLPDAVSLPVFQAFAAHSSVNCHSVACHIFDELARPCVRVCVACGPLKSSVCTVVSGLITHGRLFQASCTLTPPGVCNRHYPSHRHTMAQGSNMSSLEALIKAAQYLEENGEEGMVI